jgi:hypothetical protein
MSEKQLLPTKFADSVELIIPEFDTRPPVPVQMGKIKEGESRLIEAKVVNPATYNELEFTFNEGYREAKAGLAVIGYEILHAEKIVRRIKSEYLLDEYPEFRKEKGLNDNSANREAFLESKENYTNAVDRVIMLKAMEKLLEGNVKVFENVCRYMKKQMDLILKSGIDPNKY